MKDNDYRNFLKKMTYKELKTLVKQVSNEKVDIRLKKDLIVFIIKNFDKNTILKALGIKVNRNQESIMAKKGLHNQRIEIILALLGSIIIPVLFFLYPKLNLFERQFKDFSKFNILIIPFGASQKCNEENIICEREVESRFNLFCQNEKIKDIEIQIYSLKNVKERSISKYQALKIGRKTKSDLVIWGDYLDRCEWDSTKIRLNWSNLSSSSSLFPEKVEFEYRSISDVSNIEAGLLTGDVEEVVYHLIGLKEFKKENHEKAVAYLSKIELKEKKDFYDLNSVLGHCYFKIANSDTTLLNKSIYHYNLAWKLDSSKAYILNNRALSFSSLKKYDKSINDYNKAIEIEPNYGAYYLGRGQVYSFMDSHFKAIEDYKQALNFINTCRKDILYFELGSSYLSLNKPRESIKYLKLGTKLPKKELKIDKGIYYALLLMNYDILKDKENVIKYCNKILKNRPNDEVILQVKQKYMK